MENNPTSTLENGQDAATNALANAWANMVPGTEAVVETAEVTVPAEVATPAEVTVSGEVAAPADLSASGEVAAPAEALASTEALASAGGEALAAPAAAELGGAVLNAAAPAAEAPGVAPAEAPGVAPAEVPGTGQEAEKSLETGKVSDKEMVGYIIGRLTQDLELPGLKAMTPEAEKKRAEVDTSIKIFDQVSFVMKDNEQKNKEPVPVETILTVMAGENQYAANNSQDEAEKAERTRWANLADEWAGSYAKRKERLEIERAEAEKANAGQVTVGGAEVAVPAATEGNPVAPAGATEGNSVAATGNNPAVAGVESNPVAQNPGEAAVAQNAGEAAVTQNAAVTEGANLTPANAGETTQTLTVPLSTEGIV